MRTAVRPLITLTVAALLLASCSPDGETGQSSTSATEQTPATTLQSTDVGGRKLETVGCDDPPQEVQIVCESYDLIKDRYVDPVSDSDLAEAAAKGLDDLDGSTAGTDMVCAAPTAGFEEACRHAPGEAEDSAEAAVAMVNGLVTYTLDPNSAYLDQDSLALLEEEQSGEIEGIGALVTAEDTSSGEAEQCVVISGTCRLIIVSTFSGSPAQSAGLMADDVLVGVDGQDITGQTVDEVTASVRGHAGTDVVLTIAREDETFDVSVTRAAIVIPTVESQVVHGAGYIRLNLFTENADELFEEALRQLLDQNISGLVVDLRDNPGGLLDTAVEITSDFLPDGDVVVTESPDSTTSYGVSGHPIVPAGLDVVFVVNRGSASASEVVSAVLQERGRATIMGENTFGKNTVQQRFSLSDGGALKLTIARWVTPGGLDFGEVGITPDVEKPVDGLTAEQVVDEALSTSQTTVSAGRKS